MFISVQMREFVSVCLCVWTTVCLVLQMLIECALVVYTISKMCDLRKTACLSLEGERGSEDKMQGK